MTTPLSAAKRIVVKTGSALVADAEAGAPRTDWVASLAADIAKFRDAGAQIVLVSSGAVALGRGLLADGPAKGLDRKQAAAALGQPRLMQAFAEAFGVHGLSTAQALLTLEDTERRRRWLNARATIEALLAAGALPVINENDTVATDEIRYGDNDRLAARVAQMISADALILLSDVDGLYTADPRRDPSAEHIPMLEAIGPEHEAAATGPNTEKGGVGSGGMATKLAAAKIAHGAGCATAITLGDRPNPLTALAAGATATWILPQESPETARRQWIRGGLKAEGEIALDTGAARAVADGASVLAVGVSAVSGVFERGAAILIKGPAGELLGKGLAAYASDEISLIRGRQSGDIPGLLGYQGRPAVIHRDDLVLEDTPGPDG